MNTEKTPVFNWKPLGRPVNIIFNPGPIPMLTVTKGIAHIKISVVKGEYFFRIIAFESTLLTPLLDNEHRWPKEEILLAFNIGGVSTNQADFARENGAEFGIKSKFVRNDDRLIVHCEDWKSKKYEICFHLDEKKDGWIKKQIKQFMDFA